MFICGSEACQSTMLNVLVSIQAVVEVLGLHNLEALHKYNLICEAGFKCPISKSPKPTGFRSKPVTLPNTMSLEPQMFGKTFIVLV